MKKVPFTQAHFVAAAFDRESFPKMMTQEGRPMSEIALVGKSNVGKSSLINHLLKSGKLAKTSSTPGKTQSINFFSVDGLLALVDLPGYGYAKVSQELRSKWSDLIDHYLHTRSTLQMILLLIDSRREPTEEDRAFIQWAVFNQKPILLVFTKTDKLTQSEKQAQIFSSLKTLNNHFHSVPVYRNDLKNQSFSKKGPQSFHSERATIADKQGASENENSEVNPTQLKTDSSGHFGINFLHYSIKDPRARMELIEKINGLLHGFAQ